MKVNSGAVILSINETWSHSDDPCTLHKCYKTSDGEARIDTQRLECTASCSDDFIYKKLPGKCCGTCVPTFCTSKEKKYKIGEIWKSFDNCTVNECINNGDDVVVTSYRKSCPQIKNCPQENIEFRDCCPFCNYRSQR